MSNETLHFRITAGGARRRQVNSSYPTDVRDKESAETPVEPMEPVEPTAGSGNPADTARPENAVDERRIAELRDSLETAFTELDGRVRDELQQFGAACVELAYAAAGTITRHEVDRGRYQLDAVLREVVEDHLATLRDRPCTLHLHPEDARALSVHEVLHDLPVHCTVEADETRERGSIELVTEHCHVVRDLIGELAHLRERLLGEGGSEG